MVSGGTSDWSRRDFVKLSIAAGLGAVRAPSIGIPPSTKQYRVAFVGLGAYGSKALQSILEIPECHIVALCDINVRRLTDAAEKVFDRTKRKPQSYIDYSQLLSREQPDITLVATPDHWHAQHARAAIDSSSHVILVQPVCRTSEELLGLISASARSGRFVQIVADHRVSQSFLSLKQAIQSGLIGRVRQVNLRIEHLGVARYPLVAADVPDNIDWEKWSGPSGRCPFAVTQNSEHSASDLYPGGWRHYLGYSNGLMGEPGEGMIDFVQWTLGANVARNVASIGARRLIRRIGSAGWRLLPCPEHQIASFFLGACSVRYEHLSSAKKTETAKIVMYGDKGHVVIDWKADSWTAVVRSRSGYAENISSQGHPLTEDSIGALCLNLISGIQNKSGALCELRDLRGSTDTCLTIMNSLKSGRVLSCRPT
jgi:predicted dehydrogenase